MAAVALTNLWNFIESMSLSDKNKQWLADKLIESKNKSKREAQEKYVRESFMRAWNEVQEMRKNNYAGAQDGRDLLEEMGKW